MSLSNTSEADVLARFDHLVETGQIFYDQSFKTEYRKVDGLDFEFRISKALKNKPDNPAAPFAGALFAGAGPRPGSDINVQGLEVGPSGDTHFLSFNGFSSYRPHFLLLTADGYRRQWEPLDIDDFKAIHAFLNTNDRDYIVFYNCRAEAGCSRVHKHLQAIPKDSFHGKPWLNFDSNADALPFAYYQNTTSGIDPAVCLSAYSAGIAALERTLGKETVLENAVPPHNMIMDRGRLVVIPRRAAGIQPLGANSGGMLGTVWTQSEEMMQKWLDINPRRLLESAGVPELK